MKSATEVFSGESDCRSTRSSASSLDDRHAATMVPHSESSPPVAATSVWAGGTLPGVMAEKRPPRRSPRLALLLIASLSMHLGATTYYVAKTGDDGNPGTEESPWLTIDYAASQVVAGDSVLVKAGTYEERVDFYHNPGTAAAPIVFKSYDGWDAVIKGWVFFGVGKPHYVLEGFKVMMDSGGPKQAIRIDADSITIRGCEITPVYPNVDSHICGILTGSGHWHGTVIDSNWCHNFGSGLTSHGIYLHQSFGSIVTRNICNNNGKRGIVIYPNTDSCEVAYNICYNNGRGGMVVEGRSNRIHHNLLYDNYPYGLTVTEYVTPSEDIQIYNNVFFNNQYGGIEITGDGNHTVTNNIFFRNGYTNGYKLEIYYHSNNNIRSDYNCFYPDGSGAFWYNGTSGSYADYRAATGKDSNSICQDPLLVDTAARNFRLQAGSPCIDAGDPTTPFRVDLEGISAPQGAGVDIGAYEFCPTDVRTQPASDSGKTFAFTPNPVSGGFATVRCSQPLAGSATFEVFNASGRLVRSSFIVQRSSFRVDFRSMPAGVYLVRVTSDGASTTQKLVVAGN